MRESSDANLPDLIKQDINFLEFSLWIPNERFANSCPPGYVWQDRRGYTYRCGYKPASKMDSVFLFSILHMCQEAGFSDRIETTCAELLRIAEINKNSKTYDRLKDSLERWVNITVKFSGTFYDNKKYTTIQFGIIDNWEIDTVTKKLKIKLNEKFMLQVKNTSYYKYLNINDIKNLQSPVASRLFEILCKSFLKSNVFKIDAKLLATKMILKQAHVSDISIELKRAVKSINADTTMLIELECVKKGTNETLLVFTNKTPKKLDRYITPKDSDIVIKKKKPHLVLNKDNIVPGSVGYEIYSYFENDEIINSIITNKSVWTDIKEFCNNSGIPVGEHFFRLRNCLLEIKEKIKNPKTKPITNRIGFTRTLLKSISLEEKLELSDIRTIEFLKTQNKQVPKTELLNTSIAKKKLKPTVITPIKRRK